MESEDIAPSFIYHKALELATELSMLSFLSLLVVWDVDLSNDVIV